MFNSNVLHSLLDTFYTYVAPPVECLKAICQPKVLDLLEEGEVSWRDIILRGAKPFFSLPLKDLLHGDNLQIALK